MKRNVCVMVLVGLVFAAFCSAQETSTLPATQPVGAAAELAKIKSLMGGSPDDQVSRENSIKSLKQRLPEALSVLTEMEQKYPQAEELHEARLMGLVSAVQLARLNNDQAGIEQAKAIGAKIIDSDAPSQLKLKADTYLLMIKLKPVVAATTAPASEPATKPAPTDTTEAIRQFAKRYADTDVAVEAILTGMQVAHMVKDQKIFDELLEKLAKDYADNPLARPVLRQLGKGTYTDVGKPFTAALTKLDGTKLALPDDLRGKVVVIDFWATWCGPCVQTLPHLKAMYAKYKPQGVEIVGISLDNDLQQLKSFVEANKMGWIITYSGKGGNDPTAKQYGISSIPSVWVIGKDGKVVSDNARSNLAETIEKALSAGKAAPTTKPD